MCLTFLTLVSLYLQLLWKCPHFKSIRWHFWVFTPRTPCPAKTLPSELGQLCTTLWNTNLWEIIVEPGKRESSWSMLTHSTTLQLPRKNISMRARTVFASLFALAFLFIYFWAHINKFWFNRVKEKYLHHSQFSVASQMRILVIVLSSAQNKSSSIFRFQRKCHQCKDLCPNQSWSFMTLFVMVSAAIIEFL